jgi:hypothetical protein
MAGLVAYESSGDDDAPFFFAPVASSGALTTCLAHVLAHSSTHSLVYALNSPGRALPASPCACLDALFDRDGDIAGHHHWSVELVSQTVVSDRSWESRITCHSVTCMRNCIPLFSMMGISFTLHLRKFKKKKNKKKS